MATDQPPIASGQMTETVNGFRRTLVMVSPFDRRHPDANKNYGIGGIRLTAILHKDNLAVQFVALLPVYLTHVSEELWGKRPEYNPFKGMGADVGYHSSKPQFDGHTEMDCDILSGGKCYYDGSSLRAEEWYEDFLVGGLDLIWSKLEGYWNEMNGEGDGD